MKVKYSLKRAINPGEDYHTDQRIVAQIQQDVKQTQNSKSSDVEEFLNIKPVSGQDFLFKRLEI
jgi:hypothetical protein